MELVGYKLEGIHKNQFVKGNMIDDAVSISCSYEDYLYLKKKRSNLFWDGNNKMMERYRKKIKLNHLSKLLKSFDKKRTEYYNKIFNL